MDIADLPRLFEAWNRKRGASGGVDAMSGFAFQMASGLVDLAKLASDARKRSRERKRLPFTAAAINHPIARRSEHQWFRRDSLCS